MSRRVVGVARNITCPEIPERMQRWFRILVMLVVGGYLPENTRTDAALVSGSSLCFPWGQERWKRLTAKPIQAPS